MTERVLTLYHLRIFHEIVVIFGSINKIYIVFTSYSKGDACLHIVSIQFSLLIY